MGMHQGKELTRNSSGNARPQPPLLAETLWADPGLKKVELVGTSKADDQKFNSIRFI